MRTHHYGAAEQLHFQRIRLPSWNRRGGAKRRGGSQIQKFPFIQLPPLAGSASRSRCPPILGGQFVVCRTCSTVRKLIRAFLAAGVMQDGLVSPVDEGT